MHHGSADDAGGGRQDDADQADGDRQAAAHLCRTGSAWSCIIFSAMPERSSISPMKMNMGRATRTQLYISW